LNKDISQIRVKNLQNKSYTDKTENYVVKTETSPAIAITQETDRVYQDVDPAMPVIIASAVDDRTILSITREGLNTITLWNPWSEKAKGMSDFGDEEYKEMVCVEPGAVGGWQTLDAGDAWEGTQTIRSNL